MKPRRRRTQLSFEKACAILARMAEGEGLAPAARALAVAPSTFRNWVRTDPTGELGPEFERVQAIRALMYQHEIFDLIEMGVRDTDRQIRWRQAFIADWLPARFRPGYEYRRK